MLYSISTSFCIHSYITFSTSSKRSTTHSLAKSNTIGHFYFNRLPRLWNSLPTSNLDLPISTIKKKLLRFFWDHFNTHFQCNNLCTFHYLCPCAKCVRLPIKSNSSFRAPVSISGVPSVHNSLVILFFCLCILMLLCTVKYNK